MSSSLATNFCGFELKNPFLLASTSASRAHNWSRIARAGWAGGVTWGGERTGRPHFPRLYSSSPGSFIDPDDPSWRVQMVWGAMPPGITGAGDKTDLDVLARLVSEAKKSGLLVCANIMERGEVDPWVSASKVAEAAGADMLELNLSCPVPGFGLYFSHDLPLNAEIVKSVRKATTIPIMAKLHAWLLSEDLKAQAKTVVEAGASAISVSNSIRGLAGINIDTGLPWAADINPEGMLVGTVSSIFGPALYMPLSLRAIAEISSVVDVPISGMGGISNWRHAVEYMMAGCTTVQVGMAAMLFGFGMVKDLISGLTGFMEQKGYRQLNDFVGLTRHKVANFGELRVSTAYDLKRRMLVDEKLCDGCGRCVGCCIATAEGAMKMRKRVAYIEQEKCIQCNACMLICPQRAITSVPV